MTPNARLSNSAPSLAARAGGLARFASVATLALLLSCASWFREEEPAPALGEPVEALADEVATAGSAEATAPAPTTTPTPTPTPTPEPTPAPAPKPTSPAPPSAANNYGLIPPGVPRLISNPFRAGRSMTVSRKGIVASSHVFASEAGVNVLRNGGNAMDAAIAAAAVLGVVEPMMTGLGGDVWMLYYEAATGKVHALNGSGRSPAELKREYFDRKPAAEIVSTSWESVTVPGAADAWVTGLERFGSKPLAELLAPAISYAEDGFPVSEIVATYWQSFAAGMEKDPMTAEIYLPGGRPPAVGEVFRNPRLARTMRQFADGGRDAFYRGEIAKEIVRYAQATGGFLTMPDFENHRSTWMEPIHTNYRGYEVYQCPPNGQGVAVLLMLNILENFDLRAMEPNSAELLHLLIETKKLAYAELGPYVSDPATAGNPVEELLAKTHAAERAKLIDPVRALDLPESDLPSGSDTIYLCTIDAQGNSVSLINSLFAGFGSKRVGGETGIVLQNRGNGFNLKPGHPNEYAPGKLPFHTLVPGMVLKDGGLYLTYGVMGGAYQPQGHVHLLVNHLDFGYGLQEAVDLPRWRHQGGALSFIEHGAPQAVAEGLRAKGHNVRGIGPSMFGGAQAILVHPRTGSYFGASDSRKDGAAIGF